MEISHEDSYLAFNITFPFLMVLLGFGQDLNLEEMLVSLEERKLFEKSIPCGLLLLTVGHQMLGDFHGFL